MSQALTLLENRRVNTAAIEASRFDELIKQQIQLETHPGQPALPYINERLIVRLDQINQCIISAYNQYDYKRVIILNQGFHSMIYSANPDQLVMPMIKSAWLQLDYFVRLN